MFRRNDLYTQFKIPQSSDCLMKPNFALREKKYTLDFFKVIQIARTVGTENCDLLGVK